MYYFVSAFLIQHNVSDIHLYFGIQMYTKVTDSFLLLSSISLYEYTTVHLFFFF